MGYSTWDIAQMTDAYRQNKLYQLMPQSTNISVDTDSSVAQALPNVYEFSYLTQGYDADFLKNLEKELPPIFSRQIAAKKSGGLISVKTLSNLDSLHKGPSVKVRIGSKIGYERTDFLQWLRSRMG